MKTQALELESVAPAPPYSPGPLGPGGVRQDKGAVILASSRTDRRKCFQGGLNEASAIGMGGHFFALGGKFLEENSGRDCLEGRLLDENSGRDGLEGKFSEENNGRDALKGTFLDENSGRDGL